MDNICQDYFINAHGATIGNFELPYNVRILMLCSENKMTACSQNEFNIFSTITQPYGEKLENLNKLYNETNIDDTQILKSYYKLCVFSPNFNPDYLIKNNILLKDDRELFLEGTKGVSRLCPNLVLTPEYIYFRSGVYNVPLNYNRIYINDHISNNELIKAGTIQKIDTNILFKKKLQDKKRGKIPLNRLEQLIVRPIPSYKSTSKGSYALAEATQFINKHQNTINNILKNVLSLDSIVVPNPHKYMPLNSIYKPTQSRTLTLEDVAIELSNKHPFKIVTIMVGACRNNNYNVETIQGFSLENEYNNSNYVWNYKDDYYEISANIGNELIDITKRKFSSKDIDLFKENIKKEEERRKIQYNKEIKLTTNMMKIEPTIKTEEEKLYPEDWGYDPDNPGHCLDKHQFKNKALKYKKKYFELKNKFNL